MKSILLLTFLTFISVTKYVACGTAPRVDETTPTSDGPCKVELWARTYGAMSRFGQLKRNYTSLYDRHNLDHRCVFDVKGVVQAVAPQPDGDMKVYLTLDDANFAYAGAVAPYVPLKKNEFYPLGDMVDGKKRWMVAEIVCAAPKQKRGKGIDPKTGKEWKLPEEWSPVTDSQNDGAVLACRGYDNTVYIPHPPRQLRDGTWVREEVYVTGELITDRGPKTNPEWNEKSPPWVPQHIPGHGHKEIHPVAAIRK